MRDIKTLLREAMALETDEARYVWIAALTPDERNLFWNEGINPLMEKAQEFICALAEQAKATIDLFAPVFDGLAETLGAVDWQPSQNDSDDAP